MKKFNKILFLFVFAILLQACATQKSRSDISGFKKFYHNTTAKYNGYYNADVLFNESINTLNFEHQDNYNQILDVYPYVATDKESAVAGSLDEAIKKVSVVVSLHRVSHWTDDCYLMLGKSQYVKKDYEDAQETLEYMVEEYSPEAIANRERKLSKSKKKKKKRKGGYGSKKKKKKAPATKRKTVPKSQKKLPKKKKKKSRRPTYGSGKKKKAPVKKKTEEVVKEEKKVVETAPKIVEKTKEEKAAKKGKEEDVDDENYFLKHKPAFQEGQLWLARTYIEREMWREAESILFGLERDPLTFKEIQDELPAVKAHYFLKQKKYEEAIEPLNAAIEGANKKGEKARYAYIIAQIHQKNGRTQQAKEGYARALKFSPSYDMEFSSRINLAKTNWANGETTTEQTVKLLERMLKDIKNDEYQDQIYYTLATISLEAKNKPEAIVYFKKALLYSTGNAVQKAESYLQLATLYFDGQDYVNASNYYDSTLVVMPKTDERFNSVTSYSENLKDIANHIENIRLQDSLLTIARLSPEDQKALAFTIKKEQDKMRLEKLKAAANQPASTVTKGRAGFVNQGRAGNPLATNVFFAYNDRSLKKGERDFQKKWGDRVLEDNWRRGSKESNNIFEEGEVASEEVLNRALTDDDVKNILKDVPSGANDIARAERIIEESMFALGTLYRDRLGENKLTVETLEDLNKRFPEGEKELDSWYFLYLAHTDLNNTREAKFYFDKIVKKYPNSTFGRVLVDPDYLANSQSEEAKLINYYDETYKLFGQDKFQDAFNRIAKVEETFGAGNDLQPKFALLNAMCIGNLKGKDEYIASLKDVVAKYKDTPEQTRAKEILRLLGGGSGRKTEGKAAGNFKVEEDRIHYFIIALKGNSIKLNAAKIAVSDFNKEFVSLQSLRITNIYLGSDTKNPVLIIRKFKDQDQAMSYYETINKNKESFLPAGTDFEIFPVTQNNYRQVLKSQTLESYRGFFEDNYL